MAGKRYKADYARRAFHRFVTAGPSEDNEWRAFCPLCENPDESKTPSASINFERNVWKCAGKCGLGGTVYDLVTQMKQQFGFDVRSEYGKGMHKDESVQPPSAYRAGTAKRELKQDEVEAWHRKLIGNTVVLTDLKNERGFVDDTIRRFKIGWDGSRYTIPIYDAEGNLVNVRRYKLHAAKDSDKMLNIPGHGEGRIYGLDTLAENETVILTEGETDRIIGCQEGLPCVTHTAGAATFKLAWGPLFQGKTVYICYDNDEAGRTGASKAAKVMDGFAEAVYRIDIPLPQRGADLTDFLWKEGHSADEFRELMVNAPAMRASQHVSAEEAPLVGKQVTLEDSMSEEHTKGTLEIIGTVAGKQNPPYIVPKRMTVTCDMSKGAPCQVCPVFLRDGQMVKDFGPDDDTLFRFIGRTEEQRRKLLREISGARCGDRSEFDVDATYTMEELTLGNSVDNQDPTKTQRPVSRRVFSVSTHATEVNTVVRVVGKNTVDPDTSRLAFMSWQTSPVATSLDTFRLDEEMRNGFLEFRTKDYQTPLEKCLEIAADMARSVTRIYGRDLLHVVYDLVWHSPLSFRVDGESLDKGWLEAMVVGDTRTGKSEIAYRLGGHYRSGVVKSCEGATFAGLVGGVQQIGSSWMTTWGVIPLNDRRLVVLDEVSGLKDRDVIENMSSIRSSGRAQIVKIDTQETSARTRLIWITNPGDGSMLDDKPDVGVAALRTIVQANEDIARFDMVAGVRASEVSPDVINAHHETEEPRYPSSVSAALVLWVWSLTPDQIEFTDRAARRGRELAKRVGEEYVPDPPLLQTENARFKLYRIAAAIAARTFSVRWPRKGEAVLLVTEDHVDSAYELLSMLYDSPAMQYRSKSKKILEGRRIAVDRKFAVRGFLLEHSDTVLHALQAVGGSSFRVRDFKEMAGMTDDQGQQATKTLLNMRMIERRPRGELFMTKALIDVLRELEEEGLA